MKQAWIYTFAVCLLWSCGPAEKNEEIKVEKKEVVKEKKDNKPLLRHVVLFSFKEGTTQAEVKEVEDAFKALPKKIPQIKGFEWGTNNSPEGLDKGFTHCFFLTFESEADRYVYLPHPDHKAFGEVLKPYLKDVLVVDYWTTQ
ncbi:Dabb family protein [Pararhodonellum marinum]|uniref:Dabb family protein n=1 Tax=Pararhodonellum marinum TaxID=2755358 RepID=UPI00188EDC2B|nr:Dabb family protein [Pararhodonellum marinum]